MGPLQIYVLCFMALSFCISINRITNVDDTHSKSAKFLAALFVIVSEIATIYFVATA